MTYNKRIFTAIATGAVLLNAMAPIALADTVTVSGNGALSNNAVNVSNSSNTVVNQTNNANITNHVDSSASTGGNSSNFNTGGNSTIVTGNATNNVSVSNAANLNQATVSCGCASAGATNVTVTGNGAYSNNGVSANNANQVFLNQNNDANFNNDVNAKSSTGKNDSSYNTGGSTVILTGNATTNVSVDNKANANIANVGGGNGGNAGGSSVTISGNGAFSNSGVALNNESAVVLDQNNNANISNDVNATAKTGDNESQFNTGGNNGIQTGDAKTNVSVDNLANFNAADLNCDCTLDGLTVKVAGNGAESDNAVNADSANAVFPTQDNNASLWNDVFGNGKTGDNTLGFSTGSVLGDPVIITGNSTSKTNVDNAGNVNVLDNGNSVSLPGNWNLGVSFDLTGFLGFLNSVV